jgi:type IV secretory pathway VirD2 relaxase
MFDKAGDAADTRAFAERCQGDRHHFCCIVSPDDALELSDLRAFTRDLMALESRDLGTKIDLGHRRSLEHGLDPTVILVANSGSP